MSIEINSIKQNQINTANNKMVVAFKSNPLPNDKVELSTKKELSNGTKIGIGVGIATVIGLGLELIWGKGKHLKTLWEKISGKGGKKPPKKPEGTGNKPKGINEGEKPKTTGSNTIPQIADFRTVDEAKAWFDNFGIKTEFRDISNSDLGYINKLAYDFAELDRLGVTISKPDSLVISDWTKIDELVGLYRERNIMPDIDTLRTHTGYWGRARIGTDNKIHIFLNSNKLDIGTNEQVIQHEIGHHCRIAEDSVLNKINDLENLGDKKLEVLGYKTNLEHKDIFGKDWEYCAIPDGAEFACSLSENGHFIHNYPVLSGKGITDLFKREVTKSYHYKDYEADEFAADIFKGLTTGKTFSDEVMLAYDFINGGRVPNLIIKGKKYDDYIKSLYDNPELVQKLRNMIKLKYVDRIVEGRAILKDASREAQEALMRENLQP